MKSATTGFQKIEEDMLAFEVSDDALEIAAGAAEEPAAACLSARVDRLECT